MVEITEYLGIQNNLVEIEDIMEEIHSFVWMEDERRLRDLKLFLLRSKKMKRRRLKIFVIENKMEIINTYVELKDN